MTKSEELAILKAAARQLGPDSYLGPWLDSVLPELESAIRSDFIPVVTFSEAKQQAGAIIAQAQLDAGAVREKAERETSQLRKRADDYLASCLESLRGAMRALSA